MPPGPEIRPPEPVDGGLPRLGDVRSAARIDVELPDSTLRGHVIEFSVGALHGSVLLARSDGEVASLEDAVVLARAQATKMGAANSRASPMPGDHRVQMQPATPRRPTGDPQRPPRTRSSRSPLTTESNVRAAWLLGTMSAYGPFAKLDEHRRLRALEAALFMIGYVVPDSMVSPGASG